MKIEKVYYRLNHNLGDGCSEQFTITAEIEQGETIKECFDDLREISREAQLPQRWEIIDKIRQGTEALQELERKISRKTAQWEEISNFLRAQGLNPDAPKLPLPLALPESVQGEIVQEEEEEEEKI